WTPIGDAQASLAIGSLLVDPTSPDTIYAGTGEGALTAGFYGAGILKSTDAGATWSLLAGSTFEGLAIPRLLRGPSHGDLFPAAVFGVAGRGEPCGNLYYDAPKQGVYRSSDDGATWTQILDGKISDLEIDFTASPLHILVVDFEQGARVSTDGGASF